MAEPEESSFVPHQSSTMPQQIPINDNIPVYFVPDDEVIENIDADDITNPYTCSIYSADVYAYLKQLEISTRPTPNYLQKQPQLNARTRAYCVDWLADLHRTLSRTYQASLQADTLFTSISLFDRFLSVRQIPQDKPYLAAISCFLIATKFEETYYPSVNQLLRFAPKVGTKEDILKMERFILSDLGYAVGSPTPLTFLKRYAKASHADPTLGMLSRFMSEYSQMNYSLATNYLPSQIASSAIAHSRIISGQTPWTATLQYYTGYTYQDLADCMREMKVAIQKAPMLKTQTIYRKYASSKYLNAAVTASTHI
ncbi:putative G2/mitotic-specific cyclin-B2 [Blattamonas nauphoetae]|uniref:G2/mitotic-specific cyclin-B2 n=1 Tax=Blattamonas nauphoetae TaxID=2049346 RepID=A0ABQ9XT91_9EUKA|nr:putative G2/mitotic-specific cyclin-B2 [Blattamonas nauphoetae]